MTASNPHAALRRTLGPVQITLYGLGSMLGAGIYALIGQAAGVMGNAVWIAFLAAMCAAVLTGLTYASLGSRYPKAGGAAYVTQRAFGRPMLSYVVGLVVMMSGLTSMAAGSQAIAENVLRLFGTTGNGTYAVPLLAIGLVLLLAGLLIKGIRESMAVNIVCTVIEAAGLLFIIAAGMRFWGSVDLLQFPARPATAPHGEATTVFLLILNGAVLTLFSFIGFEDILNVSEEVKNPRRDIPIGLLAAMGMATVLYLAVSITAVSVIPAADLAAAGSTPLVEVAKKAAPWFTGIETVYVVITVFSIANTALLNYLMGSRLLYGMSRQGLLPAALGRVNARTRTPVFAIATLFVIVAVLILSGRVKSLAEATSLLLLSVFTVMNVGLIILKRRPAEARGGFDVPAIVPVLGAVVCLGLIVGRVYLALNNPNESVRSAAQVAPLIAGAIVATAALLFLARRPRAEAIIAAHSDDA